MFGLVIALNSRLLLDGSLKNIVHYSAGVFMNLRWGCMMKVTLWAYNWSDNKWNYSTESAIPKWGTGT